MVNSPKQIYYSIIIENDINNVFSNIKDFSYTRKTRILEHLLLDYNSTVVNLALEKYEKEFVDLKRVNMGTIQNVLKGLCQYYFQKG